MPSKIVNSIPSSIGIQRVAGYRSTTEHIQITFRPSLISIKTEPAAYGLGSCPRKFVAAHRCLPSESGSLCRLHLTLVLFVPMRSSYRILLQQRQSSASRATQAIAVFWTPTAGNKLGNSQFGTVSRIQARGVSCQR
jgi:hypothetical protein